MAQPLDPGGGPVPLADFTLRDKGGQLIGVLEVTSITDQGLEEFSSSRAARQDERWGGGYLERNWLVRMRHSSVRLAPLRTALVRVLRDLERDGVDHAYAEPSPYLEPVAPLPADIVAAGVVEIEAVPSGGDDDGRIFFHVISGGAYGIDTLTVAVEAEALREHNRAKLRRDLERRELFIWVNSPMPRGALMTYNSAPFAAKVASARPPTLPNEITAVWVAVWPTERDRTLALALWQGTSSGWRVRTPTARLSPHS